jgi:hypothetical protein
MRIYGIVTSGPPMHRGAFVIVDPDTRETSYSYPTSPNAQSAALSPSSARRIAVNQSLEPNSLQGDPQKFEHVCELLQYVGDIRGISKGVDLADAPSITYELSGHEALSLLAYCGEESKWSQALRLCVPCT